MLTHHKSLLSSNSLFTDKISQHCIKFVGTNLTALETNQRRACVAKLQGNGMQPAPDVNVYQQKKTIAEGMMDIALISANANQFRYVLQANGKHPYYYASLAMIGLSLLLQVVVGIGLIWNSRYNVKDDSEMQKANRANNWTVIAIFSVTILNVFISAFSVVENA